MKGGAGVSKGAVMLIAGMSSFITPFTFSSVNIALPSIGRDLQLNAVVLGWVATAYLLAAAASWCRSAASPISAAARGSSWSA